jgi:hypothetical protein
MLSLSKHGAWLGFDKLSLTYPVTLSLSKGNVTLILSKGNLV